MSVLPATMAVSDRSLSEMADLLEVISSEVRLQILRQLREPQRVSAIRVTAGLTREGERDGRPLSRQAVTHHLDQLIEVGLVKRSPLGGDKRGAAYIVDHGRLFAMIDELRKLNLLRPFLDEPADVSKTLSGAAVPVGELPRRPRLLEAYGAEDGRGFSLPHGKEAILGRAPGCSIHLDHDPYISGEHCRLVPGDGCWVVEDLGSSNGTWVNWDRVHPGEPADVTPGDLLRVGRTHLVLQV